MTGEHGSLPDLPRRAVRRAAPPPPLGGNAGGQAATPWSAPTTPVPSPSPHDAAQAIRRHDRASTDPVPRTVESAPGPAEPDARQDEKPLPWQAWLIFLVVCGGTVLVIVLLMTDDWLVAAAAAGIAALAVAVALWAHGRATRHPGRPDRTSAG